ncbi:hypothetical protein AB0J83_50460, partial [Actinoplanes sp. NPDC049596]
MRVVQGDVGQEVVVLAVGGRLRVVQGDVRGDLVATAGVVRRQVRPELVVGMAGGPRAVVQLVVGVVRGPRAVVQLVVGGALGVFVAVRSFSGGLKLPQIGPECTVRADG